MEQGRLQTIVERQTLAGQRPARMFLDEKKALWTRLVSDLMRIDPPDLKMAPRLPNITGLGNDSAGRIIAACPTGIFRLQDDSWSEVARFSSPIAASTKLIEDSFG